MLFKRNSKIQKLKNQSFYFDLNNNINNNIQPKNF